MQSLLLLMIIAFISRQSTAIIVTTNFAIYGYFLEVYTGIGGRTGRQKMGQLFVCLKSGYLETVPCEKMRNCLIMDDTVAK